MGAFNMELHRFLPLTTLFEKNLNVFEYPVNDYSNYPPSTATP